MKTMLLTGFEPFDGEPVNPSWELVKALDGTLVTQGDHQARLVAVQLPCVFSRSLAALDAALQQHQPDIVLAVGQAGGRSDLTLERVAINLMDARIPDNDGAQPVDVPVLPAGPAAYFSTLPIKAMVAAMRAAGVPASVSQTAGSFVCNQVFYGLQHRLAGSEVRGGFLHIPYLPEQVARLANGAPSCSLETMTHGLLAALLAALATQTDLAVTEGALH
ncbi:pyroglutamyl-peptidase I [Aeromonas cavernicola]|uniref:Pyrrolidone-carboxylate peptidase n=1 Tax=Aeromonas cavernicola TaxID=1006623 RepID=A0A2H9U2F1_9GAMM|nr:pyroglutamyl-peptidase I [Aeromonas cavernicola]PJG58184.1 pyroglutamyl-peptidase I [Aeromonas cavernicola]